MLILLVEKKNYDPTYACYIVGKQYNVSSHKLWLDHFQILQEHYKPGSETVKVNPQIALEVLTGRI